MSTACTASDSATWAWRYPLDPDKAIKTLGRDTLLQIRDFLISSGYTGPLQSYRDVANIRLRAKDLPRLSAELSAHITTVLPRWGFLVLRPPSELLSFDHALALSWFAGTILGELLAQNDLGDKLYLVADRGGRMEEGARYSQTKQGGHFHTDGVNLSSGLRYFLLHAVACAEKGGESILLDGLTVYEELSKRFPEKLSILESEFVWEFKGVRPGEFYRKPIVQKNARGIEWCYLRPYVEEGAKKFGAPLDRAQLEALDALDSVLNDPTLHGRFHLKAGDILIVDDRRLFHGRTEFEDHVDAVELDLYLQSPRSSTQHIKRSYLRLWVA